MEIELYCLLIFTLNGIVKTQSQWSFYIIFFSIKLFVFIVPIPLIIYNLILNLVFPKPNMFFFVPLLVKNPLNLKITLVLVKYDIWTCSLYYLYNLVELSKWVGTREPNRLTMSSDGVGLKFFYKFQYELIFDAAHLEPSSPELNLWWAGLAHQPVDKRVTQVFFIYFY